MGRKHFIGLIMNEEIPEFFRSGDLVVKFENGFLRYLCLENEEILRMVYFAVRDANWGTLPHRIENEKIKHNDAGFTLSYDCTSQKGLIDFRWQCKISGEGNEMIFEINGEAFSDFDANRIGFCVLHPIDKCSGKSVKITHPDGTSNIGYFPVAISPHQPFMDIKSMEYETDSARVILEFEGDIFETEDQRNWLDASYKTYCTPLNLPFPVSIKMGDTVHQRVTIKVFPKAKIYKSTRKDIFVLQKMEESSSLPKLGLEANLDTLNHWAKEELVTLQLSYLRIEVRFDRLDWKTNWELRLQQSDKLGLPIELVVFTTSDPDKLKKNLSKIDWQAIRVESILPLEINVLVTSSSFIKKVGPVFREVFGNVPIGGGTDFYFAQINRQRPPFVLLDFCSFSANPQVHVFDDLSIMETPNTFESMVKSVKMISRGKPVHLSPITLKPRSNPDATKKITEVEQEILRFDYRHAEPFNALWTFASIKHLAQTGASHATFYQTIGKEGLLDQNEKIIFPIYEVFAFFGRHKNANLVHTQSSNSVVFEGVLLQEGSRWFYALANFTQDSISVELNGQNVDLVANELKIMG